MTKQVYELAESLFPGAAFYDVEYTERRSSERGVLVRLGVRVHWFPDANKQPDVEITATTPEEALAALRCEAEVRAVRAKHGVAA